MRYTVPLLCILMASVLGLFAQEPYRFVVVPNGVDPNSLFSGSGGSSGSGISNMFYVTTTANQSISATVNTKLVWSNQLSGAYFDTTNSKFVAPLTGLYLFGVHVTRTDTALEYDTLQLNAYVNNNLVRRFAHGYSQADQLGNSSASFVFSLSLNSEDYVEIYGLDQTYGDTFLAGSTNCWWYGYSLQGGGGSGTLGTGTYANIFWVNKNGTDQAAPSVNIWTLMTFTNEVHDYGGCWSTNTSLFTAPSTGDYCFVGCTLWGGSVVSWNAGSLGLYVNGTNVITAGAANTTAGCGGTDHQGPILSTGPIRLNTGDTVGLYIYNQAYSSVLCGESIKTWFKGWRMN